MRASSLTAAAALGTLLAVLPVQAAAEATEPAVWLNIEVNEGAAGGPKVKINVPISMIEVVIESIDTTQIFQELRSEHGVDLAGLWQNLRDAETDEFVTIDQEDAKIQVFKDQENLRVVVQEAGYEEPNVQVRIPFTMMDYLLQGVQTDQFRLSDLVASVRGSLPLVLVEASHGEERVRIWLEER